MRKRTYPVERTFNPIIQIKSKTSWQHSLTSKAAKPIIFLSRRSRLFPDSLLLVPLSSYGE